MNTSGRVFARRFEGWFPTHQDLSGVTHREVPIPMVALVATAVGSSLLPSTLLTHLSYMPLFMSGALADSNIRSSQPIYTSMFIGVMCPPLAMLPRTENLRITQ